jgi:hypothetical protein
MLTQKLRFLPRFSTRHFAQVPLLVQSYRFLYIYICIYITLGCLETLLNWPREFVLTDSWAEHWQIVSHYLLWKPTSHKHSSRYDQLQSSSDASYCMFNYFWKLLRKCRFWNEFLLNLSNRYREISGVLKAVYILIVKDIIFILYRWPGWRSRYKDWLLLAGRPRGWSSNPGGSKHFHYSMSSRSDVEIAQPAI